MTLEIPEREREREEKMATGAANLMLLREACQCATWILSGGLIIEIPHSRNISFPKTELWNKCSLIFQVILNQFFYIF